MVPATTSSLSIVICTYNRAMLLQECIQSLLNQRISQQNWTVDILVVDNNSSDDTQRVVKSFGNSVEYIFESKQGLSYARNCGLEKSNSQWIAYLDDDALASENWIDRIIFLIEHHSFDAIGGVYLPWYRDGRRDWYLDSYATNKTWLTYESVTVLDNQFFSGGNCFYKRSCLLEHGGFPTHLGMSGSKVAYGEETALQEKMRSSGCNLGFDPELIIYHYVAPYKQNVRWFCQSALSRGNIYWEVNNKKPSPKELLFLFNSLIKGIIKDPFVAIHLLLKREFRPTNAIIYVLENFLLKFAKLSSGVKTRL